MSESENMINLGINEDIVKPILEKQIQAAVIKSLGNPEELIAKVVSMALKQKVNERGKVSGNSWEDKYDFLDLITGNAIREAAKEALRGWLQENVQLVKSMVLREMNHPERQNSLAKAFADAVEESLKCSWRFNCDVSFERDDE